MTKLFLSAFTLLFISVLATAQVDESSRNFPNRAAGDQVRMSALETFKEQFGTQQAGILHVYIDPDIDPKETYLFKGTEATGTTMALLPEKYQRMARKMNAKVYATRAIKLMGTDDHYLVRFDGRYEDRIEMFAIETNKVEHVATVATYGCRNGKCVQHDTWITDIDGDTDSELIMINRIVRDGETSSEREVVKTYDKGKWKKSKQLAKEAPWSTVDFFEVR